MLVLVHTHLCVYICSTTTLIPCSHRSEYQRFSLSVVDSLTMPILYHISRACVSACIREINANIDIYFKYIFTNTNTSTLKLAQKKHEKKQE